MTAAGRAQGASILIVDDEPEVASTLAEILAEDDHAPRRRFGKPFEPDDVRQVIEQILRAR